MKPEYSSKTEWKRDNVKALVVKVFDPKGKVIMRRHRAPNGERFTDSGIETILGRCATVIDAVFAGTDYRLVEVPAGPGARQFNFLPRRDGNGLAA